MKAVILAGGEGTRLRPLTSNQPKPMMPIANVPMMEHIVRLLAEHGFDDIVVTVAFLANHIRNYFGDGSEFGVRMRYATEDSPLGTAGSVRNAMDELDETFLVDLRRRAHRHRPRRGREGAPRRATRSPSIALKRVENPVEFGIVITRDDGTIERFLEKPTWGEVFSDTINTGIYVLEPERLRLHPRGRGRRLLRRRVPGGARARASRCSATWSTATGRTSARSRRTAARTRTSSTAGCSVEIAGLRARARACGSARAPTSRPTPTVDGPVLIGDNSPVEAGARAAPVHRARHRRRREGRRRARAHASCTTTCYVGPSARPARRGRSGAPATSATHVRVEEGVVIGDECFVGDARDRSTRTVKIYPFKTVEAGALVTSSIVWESKGARTLFGRRGVRGLANVDITSEVAVRLAMAYGTALKKGSVVMHEPRHEPRRPARSSGRSSPAST